VTRREFSASCGSGVAALLGATRAIANAGGSYPVRRRKGVEVLYQSPDGHPNGLEAPPEGLSLITI